MKRTTPPVEHVIQDPRHGECWAACLLMALKVKRKALKPGDTTTNDITPTKIVDRTMGGKTVDLRDLGAATSFLTSAFLVYGVTATFSKNKFLWADVTRNIDQGKPFVIFYGWSNGGAHYMIGGGYEVRQSVNFILLNDPLRDKEYSISYDSLSRGNYDSEGRREPGGSWLGTHTIALA